MIVQLLARLRLPTTFLFIAMAGVACGDRAPDRPVPPQTVAPAPPVTAAPGEDRGHENPASATAPAEGTFAGIDAAEAERAASERGRQSAGDKPVGEPGSGR